MQQIINHSHKLEKENERLKAELQRCEREKAQLYERLKDKDKLIEILEKQLEKN